MSARWFTVLTLATLLLMVTARPEGSMPSRPTRPEKFSSQREVNEYVRKLQEYYSIIGRGRYGKRGHVLQSIPRSYLPLPDRSDIDLFDYISQYD